MTQITAPFTPAQVDLLNQYQSGVNSIMPGHPFTCPNRSDGVAYQDGKADYSKATHGNQGGDRGILIATQDSWVCPHCGYTQDWAHETMALPVSIDNENLMAATLSASGIDSKQTLLERIEKVISEYMALYMSRRISVSQTAEQNEQSERIWSVVAVMLASLRRRRMALLGVQISTDKVINSVDPIWRDVAQERPKDNFDVWLLMQDQPQLSSGTFAGKPMTFGGVSNPGHDGYGCNVWVQIGHFWEGGQFLSTGGYPTHWREITEDEKRDKLRKLEAEVSCAPQLTSEELEVERLRIVDGYLAKGQSLPEQFFKENFGADNVVRDFDHALMIARKYAALRDWNDARAEAFAEAWYNAGKDDDSPEALRSFLTRRFATIETGIPQTTKEP